PTEHLINITSGYVNISGFTLRDTNASLKGGVYLGSGTSNCNISNNFLRNNTYSGIHLDGSSNNTISDNTCTNNSYGIFLNSSSDNNTLTGNSASGNLLFDFYSDEESNNNEIIDFTLSGDNPTTISFTYGDGVMIRATDSIPSDPSSYTNISKYVNATNVTASSWLALNVSYDDSDISGLNESTLRILRHNSTDWSEVNGSVLNAPLNYVYANITKFSTFALMAATPLNVSSYSPSSYVSDFVGSIRSFNISLSRSADVSWLLNGSQVQINTSVTTAVYTNTSASVGLWNITAVAYNQSDKDQQTWIWNVTEDTTGPTISNLSPENGSFLNGSSHLISANFSDASGINTSLTTVSVDSEDVASNATIASSYLVYNQSSNYSDGLHNVTITVTDDSVNQNNASVTWNFTVDNVAPQTNITSGPTGTIDYNDLDFTWTGSDNQSQTSSLQYSYGLGGSWSSWTAETSKSYTDLSNGDYTFSVKARDQAGNEDQIPANRSFIVSVPTPTPALTGGGGGGGGGGAPPSGNLPTDGSGAVRSKTVIYSSNEGSSITIFQGTVALDTNGKALKTVTINPLSLGGTVGAYNYGPKGATFDPDATITMVFDPNLLSKGDTVVIKIFDGAKWTSLDTSVDLKENTATAKVSHFSIFALFVEEGTETQSIPVFSTQSQFSTPVPDNSTMQETPTEVPSNIHFGMPGIFTLLVLVAAAVIVLYLQGRNKRLK
ncbi:MAG: NosD domain-containing protein, partial [Halobacteriota archaeon]|nr:NosD domain-containing protein [Halobacteriota archaeon]